MWQSGGAEVAAGGRGGECEKRLTSLMPGREGLDIVGANRRPWRENAVD